MARSRPPSLICALLLVALLVGTSGLGLEGTSHDPSSHDETACVLCIAAGCPLALAPSQSCDPAIMRLPGALTALLDVRLPSAVQAFLGPEGMSPVGASVDWIVPTPWDPYVELTGALMNADGGDEAPVLAEQARRTPPVSPT